MSTLERDDILDVFRSINGTPTYRRPSEAERRKLISKYFPSVDRPIEELLATGDWRDDYDVDVFGRILGTLLQADAREPGARGRFAPLERDTAIARLRQIMGGGEHTSLPFGEALQLLSGWQPGNNGSSPAGAIALRALARKTSISKSRLHRLLHGDDEPTADECACAAAGFGKHPSYFVEWRVQYIVGCLTDRLRLMPEASIDFYRQAASSR